MAISREVQDRKGNTYANYEMSALTARKNIKGEKREKFENT